MVNRASNGSNLARVKAKTGNSATRVSNGSSAIGASSGKTVIIVASNGRNAIAANSFRSPAKIRTGNDVGLRPVEQTMLMTGTSVQ